MAFKKSKVITGTKEVHFYPLADWVGFDLDGTLAKYEPGDFERKGAYTFGDPIPGTIAMAKELLRLGCPVKVVTARFINYPSTKEDFQHNGALAKAVAEWTYEHIGTALEVQAHKDGFMHLLIDDRAVGVISNTGEIVGGLDSFKRLKDLLVEPSISDESLPIVFDTTPVVETMRQSIQRLKDTIIPVVTDPTPFAYADSSKPFPQFCLNIDVSADLFVKLKKIAEHRKVDFADLAHQWLESNIEDELTNVEMELAANAQL